jgi:hypothetical protein
LSNRLSQQGMDMETYFKVRNTTREQFIEDEVKPVAKKRFERSLILDEIVKKEELEVDDASLDAEFNQTLSSLVQQGMDFSKVKGGKKGQQELAQAVAMESANRVLTRRALEMLKSIAVGEYKSPEERKAEAEAEAAKIAAEVEAAAKEVAEETPSEEIAPEVEDAKAHVETDETDVQNEESAPETEADSKSEGEAS